LLRHLSNQPDEIKRIAFALDKASRNLRSKTEANVGDPNTSAVEGPQTEETEEQKREQSGKQKSLSTGLEALINITIQELRLRKQLLELARENESRVASALAVIDRDVSERFVRAETAVERRMYRAFAALGALKGGTIFGLLPVPKSNAANTAQEPKVKISKQTRG
jgi:hypothetical protein